MLKLYFGPRSPFARKVRVVLHELGLEFDSEVITKLPEPEVFGPINPMLTVPMLEHDGEHFFDSNLIIEYLLEHFPVPSPPDAFCPMASEICRVGEEKWRDKKLISVLETLSNSTVGLFMMEQYGGLKRSDVPLLQRQETRIHSCLDWLETVATPEGFMPGYLSVADISLVCMLGLMDVGSVTDWRERRSNLEAIEKLHATRPSFETTRPIASSPTGTGA